MLFNNKSESPQPLSGRIIFTSGVDFCRVHPPASRASGCFAAISRHEIFRVTALLLAPPPASAEIRLGAFRSEQDCSPD